MNEERKESKTLDSGRTIVDFRVLPKRYAPLLEEVGSRHGVLVKIIGGPGQSYAHTLHDGTPLTVVYDGVVTEGERLFRLEEDTGSLADFWNEVARLKQERENPSETTQ